jgi:hypothetical protein
MAGHMVETDGWSHWILKGLFHAEGRSLPKLCKLSVAPAYRQLPISRITGTGTHFTDTAFTGDLLVIALEQRQNFSPLSDLQERTMAQPRLRSLVLCRGVPLAGRSEPLDNILQQCILCGCMPCGGRAVEISSQIFEIFRLRPDGSELYVCKAASYNIALFDVEMLALKVPAKYVIRDRRSGQRHVQNLGTFGS